SSKSPFHKLQKPRKATDEGKNARYGPTQRLRQPTAMQQQMPIPPAPASADPKVFG
ncbi:unnamed protein product, partial [Urochloa humidicola]